MQKRCMTNLFGKKLRPKLLKTVVLAWNDISIYSEMIPYHFTEGRYYFYHTDIFYDFTAKYKTKVNNGFLSPQ